jgi:hypothetical protein
MRYISIILLLFAIVTGGCINQDITGKVSVRYAEDAQLSPDSGAVMGTARDQDGTPLLNAIILLEGEEKLEKETGTMGAFTFMGLSPGRYTITARRWNCRTLSKDIEVKPGTATNVAFFLTVVVEPEPE